MSVLSNIKNQIHETKALIAKKESIAAKDPSYKRIHSSRSLKKMLRILEEDARIASCE